MGPNPLVPQEFECCEDGEESYIAAIIPEPAQLQDRPKDQLEELVEFSLVEKEKRLNLSSYY